jgi:hypothetical protein
VITETYDIRVSLRVHTSFKNRTADNLTVTRLLNSANNWVETHQRLNITGFNKLTVEKIDFDKEFSESLTVGGQITYLVVVALTHTQA